MAQRLDEVDENARLMLQQLMHKKGLSQSELARHSGMTQPQISGILSGDRNINLTSLLRFCGVFGVTPNYFLGVKVKHLREVVRAGD